MKFFDIQRIKEAIEHLSNYEGKWLIPSLVFACNGVNRDTPVNIRELNGSDKFLDNYFNGSLIGLAPMRNGANSLRPRLKDLKRTFDMEGKADDYIIQQDTKLWANAYSRAGYRVMIDRSHVLDHGPSRFQLSDSFQSFFESSIPEDFRFEELLVWLYAFSGIDDAISSWAELYEAFTSQHLGENENFEDDYIGRFCIRTNAGVPFPSNMPNARPENTEYQRELMASSFVLGTTSSDYRNIRDELTTLFLESFQGFNQQESERLCADIVASLTASKRLFLLGEPGIGKTKLARLVVQAFRNVMGDEKLFYADEPITDKSSPESIIGYGGINGDWVPGSLTAATKGGQKLLTPADEMGDPTRRNQLNIILLDECNRRNIETLLARFQNSMDSKSMNPKDIAHSITLDASGEHYLSPWTFWIFTGNSPISDEGRVVQSRPFKRRPNLVVIPNVAEKLISTKSGDELSSSLKLFWENHCTEGLMVSKETIEDFASQLQNDKQFINDVKGFFTTLMPYEVGLSFGILEKIFRTSASMMDLGYSFTDAIDSGFSTALTPLLSTDRTVNDMSLRTQLIDQHPDFETRYPLLWKTITMVLDEGSDFGIIRPFF